MAQFATLNCGETGAPGRSHSSSFDHLRRPETFRTAMATAFFCPTNTTSRLPRIGNRSEIGAGGAIAQAAAKNQTSDKTGLLPTFIPRHCSAPLSCHSSDQDFTVAATV